MIKVGTMAELLEVCNMIVFILTERYLPLLWRMDQFSFDDSGYNKDGSVAQISIPEVRVKDHEYSSESDGEVIQVQPASRDIAFGQSYILQSAELEENPVFHIPPKEDSSSSGSNIAFASNGDNNNFDTGIIIRSRPTQRAGPTLNSQGTAPRRIRLQVGPVSTQARPTMPLVTEEKEAKHSPTASDAASMTASDNAASTTASDNAASTTGGGFDQELSSKVKPKADFLLGFRVHMPKVLLVIGLCLGAASLWSCLVY
uniref:Protein NTM1-like 9 n=1 Tax=Tanacetum cinerariifolium TaxID=118510 RepID=A0A6L2LB53_TANCI|nr:protein NTM1-like 9 [Tanacetum cinerariifolium]